MDRGGSVGGGYQGGPLLGDAAVAPPGGHALGGVGTGLLGAPRMQHSDLGSGDPPTRSGVDATRSGVDAPLLPSLTEAPAPPHVALAAAPPPVAAPAAPAPLIAASAAAHCWMGHRSVTCLAATPVGRVDLVRHLQPPAGWAIGLLARSMELGKGRSKVTLAAPAPLPAAPAAAPPPGVAPAATAPPPAAPAAAPHQVVVPAAPALPHGAAPTPAPTAPVPHHAGWGKGWASAFR